MSNARVTDEHSWTLTPPSVRRAVVELVDEGVEEVEVRVEVVIVRLASDAVDATLRTESDS